MSARADPDGIIGEVMPTALDVAVTLAEPQVP